MIVQHWSQSNTGDSPTPETVQHWRQSHTGDSTTLETVQHWRQSNTRESPKLERVQNWRDSNTEDSPTPETVQYRRQSNIGDSPTLETVEHWRQSNTGDSRTLETVQHWRQSNTGDSPTLETVQHSGSTSLLPWLVFFSVLRHCFQMCQGSMFLHFLVPLSSVTSTLYRPSIYNNPSITISVEGITLCFSITLKLNKIYTSSNTTILYFINVNNGD